MTAVGPTPPPTDHIPWGPIGEQVYKRTYSLPKADGTQETWPETVRRVVRGNLNLVNPAMTEPNEEAQLYDLFLRFAALPGGRHLRASGVPGRQFLFNCHAAGWDYADPAAHFEFMFDQLMQGGGVGSNYSNRYMQLMPAISSEVDVDVVCSVDHPNIAAVLDQGGIAIAQAIRVTNGKDEPFIVCEGTPGGPRLAALYDETLTLEDSREGWVGALGFIFRHAWNGFGKRKLCINVTPVRYEGAPLRTSGGTACGPGPLVHALVQVAKLLKPAGAQGRQLGSIEAMLLDHYISDCVVAGGIRRSSRIAVKNWLDSDIFDFIALKDIDGQHWTSNISVEVDDEFFLAYNSKSHPSHGHAREVKKAVIRRKKKNGEPGFWNRSLAMKGEREPELMFCPNPCGEIGLQMWENCNLGHINLQYYAERSTKKLHAAFRLMTRFLMRATFGDIPNPRQRAVVDRNRRIGVGFFGYHGWLALKGIRYSESWKSHEVRDALRQMRAVVDTEALSYAVILNIPVPAKTTTLAPNGTGALLPGVPASAQCMMFRRGKRRVRYSRMDAELAVKKLEGYPVYPDQDAMNTDIVEYWFEDPLVDIVRSRGADPDTLLEDQEDVPFNDSLEVQAMLQDIYANNAISFTINLPADPKRLPSDEEMEEALARVLPRLKGTTIFPAVSRANPPFERVTKEEWDAYQGPKEVSQQEDACKTGCPVV